MAIDLLTLLGNAQLVIGAACTDEDAGPGAGDRLGHLPGVLETGPGQLQQDALLRIHYRCFSGGNPEETGVEVFNTLDEAAEIDADMLAFRIDRRRPLPAPRRQTADRL